MLKNINPKNIVLTPITIASPCNLHNVDNSDLILLDSTSSVDVSIALEYVDYMNPISPGVYPSSSACSIALEQQSQDYVNFQSGQIGSGHFNAITEPRNLDGTYTRLIYSQINHTFYNSSNNPVNTFGLENIDFGLSKTNRQIRDDFLLMNVPQTIFGNTIIPNSVMMDNFSTDDEVVVYDDGYGNMMVGNNIFYRIQEVGNFENVIIAGVGGVNVTLPIICNYDNGEDYFYYPLILSSGDTLGGQQYLSYGQASVGILNSSNSPVTINMVASDGVTLYPDGNFDTSLATPFVLTGNQEIPVYINQTTNGVVSIYLNGSETPFFILNLTLQ
jgi:hypothetical protein